MSPNETEARELMRKRPALAKEIARLVNAAGMNRLQVASSGGLTKRQRDLLLYIRRHIGETGIAPSFDQMKGEFGLASKSGIHRMVKALAVRGFIVQIPGRARAIRLVQP